MAQITYQNNDREPTTLKKVEKVVGRNVIIDMETPIANSQAAVGGHYLLQTLHVCYLVNFFSWTLHTNALRRNTYGQNTVVQRSISQLELALKSKILTTKATNSSHRRRQVITLFNHILSTIDLITPYNNHDDNRTVRWSPLKLVSSPNVSHHMKMNRDTNLSNKGDVPFLTNVIVIRKLITSTTW